MEMLELPNFGHKKISEISFDSRDNVLLVI